MIKSCKICGCVYEDTIPARFDDDENKYCRETIRDCPLCKLRDEIPEMLDELEDKIKQRGIYSPEY
jgi:hypothetical protein